MGRFERDFADFGFSTGIRLAALRRIMDFTQADLADSTGLSRSHIAMLETDRRQLTLRTAVIMAHSLGVSVEDLLGCVIRERTGRDVAVRRDQT